MLFSFKKIVSWKIAGKWGASRVVESVWRGMALNINRPSLRATQLQLSMGASTSTGCLHLLFFSAVQLFIRGRRGIIFNGGIRARTSCLSRGYVYANGSNPALPRLTKVP